MRTERDMCVLCVCATVNRIGVAWPGWVGDEDENEGGQGGTVAHFFARHQVQWSD